jgi:hypothetical protein
MLQEASIERKSRRSKFLLPWPEHLLGPCCDADSWLRVGFL